MQSSVDDSNATPSFEEKLSQLNTEWHSVVNAIESSCVQNEHVAKKWWDFSKLKKKVLRWMAIKEQAADDSTVADDKSYDNIMRNATKYKVQ